MPLTGMRDQHLRILLKQGGDFDGRHVLGDGVEPFQRVGGQEEVDLADRQQDAVVHVRAALQDGDVEAVFAVGAVGERLVKPPCSASATQLVPNVTLSSAWAEAGARRRRQSATLGQHDGKPCPRHQLLLSIGDATIGEHGRIGE